jgi:chemotaxis protein methyltransferase CheR
MTTADFDYVRHFVREQAAIVLEPGKEYLVESRLFGLARSENFASIDDFMVQLRAHPNNGLHRKVVDAMTTNETSFFRDLNPFEMLKKHIMPDLIARNGIKRQLSFWCGASSTGQEPYSVMMTLAESFPDLFNWDFKFIATDLCTTVLARAKAGRFSQLEVNRGLPAPMLMKYFTRQEKDWEFRADLRKHIDFRELNLVKDWPWLPPLDVVFLRNVLIYFDIETKKSILGKVRRALRPGGYLLLGGAETTINIDDAFERVTFDKTACYRLKST